MLARWIFASEWRVLGATVAGCLVFFGLLGLLITGKHKGHCGRAQERWELRVGEQTRESAYDGLRACHDAGDIEGEAFFKKVLK